jgi:hypothetical protein
MSVSMANRELRKSKVKSQKFASEGWARFRSETIQASRPCQGSVG